MAAGAAIGIDDENGLVGIAMFAGPTLA